MTKPYNLARLKVARAQLTARDAKAAEAVKYVKELPALEAFRARERVLHRVLREAPAMYDGWWELTPYDERMALAIYAEHLKCEEAD